jgi:hypothetical protein
MMKVAGLHIGRQRADVLEPVTQASTPCRHVGLMLDEDSDYPRSNRYQRQPAVVEVDDGDPVLLGRAG